MSEHIEDIRQAVKAGRPVREHGPYRVEIGDETLRFSGTSISDPVPTGRQLLEAAGVQPISEHSVFQVLTNGLLEDLRPDETVDLRTAGVERFLVFRNDRSFRFELNERVFEWGATRISGVTLKTLAGVDLFTHDVWLDVPRGQYRQISDDEFFDLSAPGAERFFTSPRSFTIIVNGRPREVAQRQMTFLEVVRLAFPDAVINETTAYTVTFKRGPVERPEGSLVDGESVRLKERMVFNVTATDKS